MHKFTVQDILDSLGHKEVILLGNQIDNRYLKAEGVKKYIQEKLSVAHNLDLHNTKNKTLIDFGTGAGWFPYICKMYGHICIGTDVIGRPNYQPIYDFFNIKVIGDLIYSKQPINVDQKFDHIVSLRSFFPNRPRVWELDDWKFFFNDIQRLLKDNGSLYLGCNSGKRGIYKTNESASHWGPPALATIFKPYEIEPNKKLKIKPFTIHILKKDIKEIEELL